MAAISATSAQAATVTATSINPSIGGFTATYTDSNNDGLWGQFETTSFSEFTFIGLFWSRVVQLGAVAGISLSSTPLPNEPSFAFQTADYFSYVSLPAVYWTFSVIPDAPAVPLPAGMPLLLAGIGALAVLRRRRVRG